VKEGYLRAANNKDVDLLFKWVNDEDVRKSAFSTEFITYENHKKWFDNILNSDSVFQFIYCYDNESVGQIRLNTDTNKAYIDYSVDRAYRGQGHGKRMLLLTEDLVRSQFPNIKRLIAQVKDENTASQKAIESLDYRKIYIEYLKEIT
jgi:RimJ/RimL family protein N-acetyltransferase